MNAVLRASQSVLLTRVLLFLADNDSKSCSHLAGHQDSVRREHCFVKSERQRITLAATRPEISPSI
jgi:hypothetical protein